MTKTLKEILDERVQNNGWKDWAEFESKQTIANVKAQLWEAALLYGEAKFNEGMQAFADYQYNGTKPTFKP